MINRMIVALVLVSGALSASSWGENFPVKPNPQFTTGDFCTKDNPDFVGYRYAENIPYCIRNVTTERKLMIYSRYRVGEHCHREYTVDHMIPLALGGSNKDENLWPEHRNVKATRQNLEQQMYDELRAGHITQKQAVDTILYAKTNPPSVIAPSACQ